MQSKAFAWSFCVNSVQFWRSSVFFFHFCIIEFAFARWVYIGVIHASLSARCSISKILASNSEIPCSSSISSEAELLTRKRAFSVFSVLYLTVDIANFSSVATYKKNDFAQFTLFNWKKKKKLRSSDQCVWSALVHHGSSMFGFICFGMETKLCLIGDLARCKFDAYDFVANQQFCERCGGLMVSALDSRTSDQRIYCQEIRNGIRCTTRTKFCH